MRNPAAIGHWQRTTTIEVDGKTRRVPGELIKNVFTPAVTEELFYQVQKLLNDLAEQAPTVARKFPMAGLLECGSCGANMVLLRQSSKGATNTVRCYRRMQSNDNCTNQKTIPVPVALWFYIETRSPHAFRAYQRTKLPENQRLRIKLEGQIDQLKQQQARLRRLLQMDDDPEAEADYQKLVSERKQLEADLATVPTLSTGPVVNGFAFHRFMHSDAFAISNLLQLDGYRIICHQDGKLEVNRSADDNPAGQIHYIGYARKEKRWIVAYPNGDTIHVG